MRYARTIKETQAKPASLIPLLSTFELTIQNTTIPQVRNLFSVIAVFISFSPWRAAAAAAAALAADCCCCCCTRPHPTPPPLLGEGSTKKKVRLRRRWRLDIFASACAWWAWACWGGVSCKLDALCGSVKLCELSSKGTQSLAVRLKTAWFLFFLLAFASSSFSLSGSLRPFLYGPSSNHNRSRSH